jgi:hypothetical protein
MSSYSFLISAPPITKKYEEILAVYVILFTKVEPKFEPRGDTEAKSDIPS